MEVTHPMLMLHAEEARQRLRPCWPLRLDDEEDWEDEDWEEEDEWEEEEDLEF